MTQAQKIASDPQHSVYVSASAGSGKTKVLTDRVLRLLLCGNAPGKIMCLTFTKAAAAEMANRINRELMVWATADDAALEKSITSLTSEKPDEKTIQRARSLFVEVLDTPDGLKIQTIHSFCQNLMRRFPLEAGIAPHFDVIEEQTALELLREARIRLLSEKSGHHDELKRAIENISWRLNEDSFTEILKEITNNRDRIENLLAKEPASEIAKRIFEQFGLKADDSEESILAKEYPQIVINSLKECAVALLTGSANDVKCASKMLPFVNGNYNNIAEAFESYRFAFLTGKEEPTKSLATKKTADSYPFLTDIMLCEQAHVIDISDRLKSLRSARLSRDLLYISEAVLQLYKKSKNIRAYLDYNDLIMASNRLLTKENAQWVLYKLDGGIDHLLVDEAQDTSLRQWSIIEALCSEFFSGEGAREKNRTIFIVGDEKQSIFSFQGANPYLFHSRQDYFSALANDAMKSWKTVSLDMSFRSTDAVLRFVDDVFSSDEIKKAVTFKPEYAFHKAHRNNHPGRVELWPLIEKDEEVENTPWQLPVTRVAIDNPRRKTAQKIAHTIRSWLDEKRILAGKGRPVQAGDIMILVQRRNNLVDYLVRELKALDIPVAGVDRMVITDHIAVMDLIALGHFLLQPRDDLTLATILKSPLIGLSEDDLFKLAHQRGKSSLWERLRQDGAYQQEADYLLELLNKTDFISPFALYSYVLEAKGGRRKLASRLGTEIYDPVDEFLSMALKHEQLHPASLQGFLNWLEAGETEIKRDPDQGDNQIRIMTVHGSKGLQAPVIFLPDTTSVKKSESNRILWSDGDNPLMFWSGVKANMNNMLLQIAENKKLEEQNESMRLLYVAMTRAEDELYITGYSTAKNIAENCWYDILQKSMEKTGISDGDIRFIESGNLQDVIIKQPQENKIQKEITLPDFIDIPLPQEPVPSIPLAPSHISEDNPVVKSPLASSFALRGKIIHKLLQYLPDIDIEKRKNSAAGFLNKYKDELQENQIDEIYQSVDKILNHPAISHIFAAGSKAEVPLAGVIGKYVISGQIDRLLVTESEVLIIDYKTGRNPPAKVEDVHKNYLQQMAAYKVAMQKIYPSHKITCALIWTETPQVMLLDDAILKQNEKFL